MNTLQEAADCGIIDMESLQQLIYMKKKEKMLKEHPYKITLLKNGRWQTYFKRADGRLLTVRGPTKEALVDRLYDLYSSALDDSTLMSKIFEEWLDYKRSITSSPNTIARHRQHYNKYLKDTKIFSKRIGDIDRLELNAFCNSLIKEHSLTRKGWFNVKTMLNGMFEYALDKDLIVTNPMARVKITVKYKQVNKKDDGSKIFNTEEEKAFIKYLKASYSETKEMEYLAVMLNFYIGLRIGELCCLKWEDVGDLKLHVCREETRDREANALHVEEHTKSYRERYVMLVSKANDILKLARMSHPFAKDSDFIFVRDGVRLTARQITYVYERYARKTGRKVKKSHDSRRTYASKLNANGVPIDEIRKQLGHQDITTTLGYIYNPRTEQETHKLIQDALSS